MSVANGNPVFVTVGGDASAATATYTASGATTSTTITLGDLAASVASNTTAVSAAATNASAAVTTANTANTTANSAATTAASALTVANAAIPNAKIGVAGGVVGISTNGNPVMNNGGGTTKLSIGVSGANNWQQIDFYSGTTAGGQIPDFSIISQGGTGNQDGNFAVACAALLPQNTKKTALGTSNNYWSGIVSESAVQVISDANDKTVAGTIGASDYTAETTKLRAAWAAISGVVYTLNSSTNKRKHIGVIAQTVQAAFTAQGLDPSDYGLWCSTPKTKQVESMVDGKTVYTKEPVYESDGKTQATQQTIRYEELLSLGVFCERLERADLAARVTALEAKSTASTTA